MSRTRHVANNITAADSTADVANGWNESNANSTALLDEPCNGIDNVPFDDIDNVDFYVQHNLSREERLIVMLHYAEELPFDEVAGILELPQAEVERMHNDIVDRVQEALNAKKRNPQCLVMA